MASTLEATGSSTLPGDNSKEKVSFFGSEADSGPRIQSQDVGSDPKKTKAAHSRRAALQLL
jgi:hypothetical protein